MQMSKMDQPKRCFWLSIFHIFKSKRYLTCSGISMIVGNKLKYNNCEDLTLNVSVISVSRGSFWFWLSDKHRSIFDVLLVAQESLSQSCLSWYCQAAKLCKQNSTGFFAAREEIIRVFWTQIDDFSIPNGIIWKSREVFACFIFIVLLLPRRGLAALRFKHKTAKLLSCKIAKWGLSFDP